MAVVLSDHGKFKVSGNSEDYEIILSDFSV